MVLAFAFEEHGSNIYTVYTSACTFNRNTIRILIASLKEIDNFGCFFL